MLKLRDAFAVAQADYSIEACEVMFPRLRQLARGGEISEDIFHAVALSAASSVDKRYRRGRIPKAASGASR